MSPASQVKNGPMTALGKGVMDFAHILQSAQPSMGLMVELDECATDVFEAIDQSYQYLKRTV
jgi:hypothetical protein